MFDECLEPLQTAREIYEKVLSQPSTEERLLADTIQNIAEAKFELGDYTAALKISKDSLAIRLKDKVMSSPTHRDTGLNHRFIANCYRKLGDTDKAIRHCQTSVDVFREEYATRSKCQDLIADAEVMLAGFYRELGNDADAVEHYEKAKAVFLEMGNQNGVDNVKKTLTEIQNSNP